MNTKHTPGPWTQECAEAYSVRASHGGRVAMLCHLKGRNGMGGRISGNEAGANARLIAAAPDLLDALHGLIRAGHSLTASSHEWNTAHAAIAKATGEAA